MIIKKYLTISFVTITLFTISVFAQKNQNKIIVNIDSGKHTISRHIYGHFSEHLGRCIYGGIWVGKESSIPNTRGIRNDVVTALKALNIPNLRWPGGCFADEYHWKDGIGPKDQRPTMINTHWGDVTEDNSFGTHEFLDLCKQLGCEPVVCGNLGSGTIQEMSQWVEYLNSDNISPMTKLREQNGRKLPWKVKYWDLGNENWGCGGSMTAEFYADQMRRYSTFCKDYGNNQLFRIACGPYGDDYHWMEVLMKDKKNRDRFQGISLHYYTGAGSEEIRSSTNFNEKQWFNILKKALRMDEIISRHKTIMDRYDPQKKKNLIVDEWGTWYEVEPGTNPRFLYQQNTLRDALVAALTLDIFNRHGDRVKMANIAQTVNVLQAMILTKEDQMVLTPSYYVFKMYKVHQDATYLPLSITCENYTFDHNSIPAVSASASRNEQGQIHITLTNCNPKKPLTLTCELQGINKVRIKHAEIITAEKIDSHNDFDKPEKVYIKKFKSLKAEKNTISIDIPSKSIVMVELK